MIDAGADGIDIGGDSSRPGSVCVGVEEEWRRIGPLVELLAKRTWVSVDTHQVEVARRAVECGARCINDIGGGSDPEMRALIARSGVAYVFMFSASGVPHRFDRSLPAGEALQMARQWLRERTAELIAAGIRQENLIADTGMGSFVSRDPAVSEEFLRWYDLFEAPTGGLLLGCSRKGFLRRDAEVDISERDALTCLYGLVAAVRLAGRVPLYLRVHNVQMQRGSLQAVRMHRG
jgi:dihydropteroate synthase